MVQHKHNTHSYS